MRLVYGVVDGSGAHTDVSNSERGAKKYATLHGYTVVSSRDVNHYYVSIVAIKKNGKWINDPDSGEMIDE